MNKPEQIKLEDIVRPNQRLEIILASVPEEKLTSRIEEVNEKSMVIAMPMSKGYPILLSSGSKFFVRTVSNNASYQFTCIFIDKQLRPLPIWIVSLPNEIKKIQQRAFVRIDTMIPVEWQCAESEDSEVTKTITKDISGGGARLISKQPIRLGTKLKIHINLPDLEQLQLNCEVVRVEKPQSDLPVFWIGTKFIDTPESVRSKIIKFIFKKQLELRQKGL